MFIWFWNNNSSQSLVVSSGLILILRRRNKRWHDKSLGHHRIGYSILIHTPWGHVFLWQYLGSCKVCNNVFCTAVVHCYFAKMMAIFSLVKQIVWSSCSSFMSSGPPFSTWTSFSFSFNYFENVRFSAWSNQELRAVVPLITNSCSSQTHSS